MRQSGKRQGAMVALTASAVLWGATGCGPLEESQQGAAEVVSESSTAAPEQGQVSAMATPRSCREIKAANAAATSGNYTIDVDGTGALAAFTAYCDMSFSNGGWTLIVSSQSNGPSSLTAGVVLPTSATYMPTGRVQPLANISSQVHIRTAGNTNRSITSVANNRIITNLRSLKVLNDSGATVSDWRGPFATNYYLSYDCGPEPYSYPNIYWSCGNFTGLHLVTDVSAWDYSGVAEALEVYVR